MTQKWLDNSQLVTGLLIEGRISPDLFQPEQFYFEYDKIVEDIKKGLSLEELQIKHSIGMIQSCCSAANRVNGLGEKTDWSILLQKLSNEYNTGTLLEKYGRRMQEGLPVDTSMLSNSINNLRDNKSNGLVQLKDIEPRKCKTIPIGWPDIDLIFGGIPKVGLLEIAGSPKTGKSTLAAKIAGLFAKTYPKKKVLFYTLEMLDEELAMRYLEVFGKNCEVPENIYVDCKRHNVRDVVTGIAGIEDLGIVIIDYAEKLIEGETTESKMAEIFKELAFCAKNLKIPIILLASLNRTNPGGLPRPNQLRYSGAAEYEAYGCWMLYNPNNDYFAEDKEVKKTLPIVEGKAYILGWFLRGGMPLIKGNNGPRAIQMDFDGETGWGGNGKVFNLKGYS